MTPSKNVSIVMRSRGARTAALSLAGVGLLTLGAAIMDIPSATAQFRSDSATVQTPMGRAPISFADIVERVKPAVVSIHVTNGGEAKTPRRGGRNGGGVPDMFKNLPPDHPLHEWFKQFREFGQDGTPDVRPRLAQGSGFIISPDGYVVTNNHVIDGASKIEVSFDKRDKHDAELIGTDPRTDIALLKIKGNASFPHVRFADKPARVGDWVLAVGNPFGLGGTVTAGIVSALGREIGAGPYDYMQIDAAVNKGNSGGPTFNLDGSVVGVNTAIYSPSGGNVGIAFAVPASTVQSVIEQLKSSGSVSRGWLGVRIQSIDEDTAASLGLKDVKGALVSEVTSGSPAADAGLLLQDVITKVNDQPISDSRDLARRIGGYAPGTSVNVKVWRAGSERNVSVKLGKLPGSKELARLEQGKPTATEMDQLGLKLAAASPKPGAPTEVTVAEVDGGSDAAVKGLKQGDVIMEVQGQKVTSIADVEAGVKNAKSAGRSAVLLRVKSGDVRRYVAIKFKNKG